MLKLRLHRARGMLVWQRAGEDHPTLLEHLLPDPGRLLDAGERLPGRGRGCTTARVTVAGTDYLLKRFTYRSFWYGFRHIFKRSRALKVFINQSLAHAHGVSVPKPLLCLEERRSRFLRNSYVLDTYLPGSRTLDVCWDELSTVERLLVLENAGRCYGRLHRAGIMHGDSNWRNLLITGISGQLRVWLIDFDNSRQPLLFKTKSWTRDIQHFLRDIRERNLPVSDADVFREAVQLAFARET